ncbi:MAG: DUF547 domain-containing protein [Dehalococcoidia bacterium]
MPQVHVRSSLVWAAIAMALVGLVPARAAQASFDHSYEGYRTVLTAHVVGDRVNYRQLQADRARLDAVVASFARATAAEARAWSRAERLAFWINAYNVFTLRSIVDAYPIRGSWLSLYPKNSIRQIDGVFTGRRWSAAGQSLTLDEIEHKVLRAEFREPRVHFAINCASLGCPPLAAVPYTATGLDAQLDAAATRYLYGPRGLVVDRGAIRLSKIFDWFGEDFEARFAPKGPTGRSARDRALLAVVSHYGPPEAQAAARLPGARIGYLDYDWSLNDTAAAP